MSQKSIDFFQLNKFRREADEVGYENENPKQKIVESDKSKTILYESGDWKYHDNYFGGEPYGGRTVIHYRNDPVWMNVYYGSVSKNYDADEVYSFLRKALRMSAESDFRGPNKFTEGKFLYKNSWKGNIENYSGTEEIFIGNNLVYSGTYAGGLVAQRVGE